tara:strand:- start:290 stop:580 length:291 start_codon:yes stop_codon:yes gene_type:complete
MMAQSKRYIALIIDIINEKGPLTQREITDILNQDTTRKLNGRKMRNTPTKNQVGNYLAKFPHFEEVGSKQISNGISTTTYKGKVWDVNRAYLNSME